MADGNMMREGKGLLQLKCAPGVVCGMERKPDFQHVP